MTLRDAVAAVLTVVGAVLVAVGAHQLWGPGAGTLAAGLMAATIGVLLGTDR